ncbi:HAMP domain-containing protein [Acuticoccus sp.]|uniref:HAMP domain-containing protein n=1 Tax=Acuticoccus sp. TaxID=1904378 RepID=UPI003B52498A
MTRPIRALADAAERAGYGDRRATVRVGGPGEVRRPAEAFNAMQSCIPRFDAERARTVAAVGHDLRTPIMSLRIRAEMIDDPAERDAMVATLGDCARWPTGSSPTAAARHRTRRPGRSTLAQC